MIYFSSVQSLSCPTFCDPMNRSTPGLPVHHQLLEFTKLMCIKSVMPSSHLILCCPLFLLPPIPPRIRVFSNESVLHMQWPKYWNFSFSIIPSKEHPGLLLAIHPPQNDFHPRGSFQSADSYLLKDKSLKSFCSVLLCFAL